VGNALSKEQFRELTSQVVHGIPIDLSVEDYSYWTANPAELNATISVVLRRGLKVPLPDDEVPVVSLGRREQPAPTLLKAITTVTLPAIPSFDAGAHFVVTPDKARKKAELVIGWIGDNAKRLVKGFVEPEVAEATLRVHTLTKASVDGPIIAELGGEEVITTTWGQMHKMMWRQGRGQQGTLLTNGYANIFYIRCSDGAVWAVGCHWLSVCGDWDVGAYPITFPYWWNVGYLIVSR